MNGLQIYGRGDRLCFRVLVQPRASRLEIAGIQGEALKIRLTAPPVEDQANRQLIPFLADSLGIPKHRVSILSGRRNRTKTVAVSGLTVAELERRIAQHLV